ncbi:MAG: FkbM family methyltransferase [Verrucomicrobia bacterium]|nr:FkbM family methyltransferase [Verrucomicrobiota bacterium]NBU08788.1 FkbM family methyltransferase [Pseudomonadota bacterium]NDA65481.1 FkbM family methyltransferase [Verrucomicrobiota bacterium]NDB74336.1 FkbM family methyltransferase [Verrucomicrobiota bacterium]NDD36827.1 FkbM family methyltransferase [Verrucomicrobiota bacterium]
MPSLLSTFEFIRDRRRILRLPHAKPSAKAIYHAWLQLRRYPKANRDKPLTIELGETVIHAQNWLELDFLFNEVFVGNEYYVKLPRRDPFIIDCGANIGCTTLYFKLHYPDARILAFEPNPYCFEMLKKNVEANGLKHVALVQAACASAPGTTTFHVNPTFSPLSSAIGNRDEKQKTVPIEVRLVKLSDSITENVDLLKLDIEGGEWDVFADLVASGKLARIDRMAIEYHHRFGTTEVKMSRFLKILEDAGYTYSVGVDIKAERRFMGVFQDVMIYAVKLGMEEKAH